MTANNKKHDAPKTERRKEVEILASEIEERTRKTEYLNNRYRLN